MTVQVRASSYIKETSTTTGTGDYTLAGAASGYGAFTDVLSNGDYTIYTATDGNSFENGIGLMVDPTTLSRIFVFRSSNANAAVNWAAGTRNIFISDVGDLYAQTVKLDSRTGAPGTTKDIAHGYTPFSLWRDTNDAGFGTVYMCTDPASTAAIWWRLVLSDLTNSLGAGTASGSVGKHNNASFVNSWALGEYAQTARKNSLVIGSNAGNTAIQGAMQGELVVLGAQTTDATPAIMQPSSSSSDKIAMPIHSAIAIDGIATAYSDASTLVSSWSVSGLYRRGASGDPVAVGSPTVTMLYQDAGASTWALAIGVDSTNHAVKLTATGAAATTIGWTFIGRIAHVGF